MFEKLLYDNITPTKTYNKYITRWGKIETHEKEEKIFRIKARLLEVFESKKGATCIRYIPYSIFSTNDGEIIEKIRNESNNIDDPKQNIICINKKYDTTKILREYEHKDLLRNIVNIGLVVKITKYKNKFYIDILREPKTKFEGEDTFITDLDKRFNNCLHDNEKEYNEYEDENEDEYEEEQKETKEEQIYNDIYIN